VKLDPVPARGPVHTLGEEKPSSAKPLKSFGGASVPEIVEDFDSDTYRAVYTVRLRSGIYVLHAFQKTSTRGIKTSKRGIDLIEARLKEAIENDKKRSNQRRIQGNREFWQRVR